MQKHILYLHQYFSTPEGSSGTRSYEFAKHLVDKGFKVTIITGINDVSDLNSEKKIIKKNIDGINVIVINLKYSNKLNIAQRIIKFIQFAIESTKVGLKEKNIDLVFATSTPLTIGIPGYIVSKIKKAPFVFEVRDLWPDVPVEMGTLKNKLLIKIAYWLETFLYQKSNKIIALSPGMKEGIISKGVTENKIKVIPNLANLELFNPQINGESFRNELNLKNTDFLCIHTGAMGAVNGLSIVLEAAKILQDQNINDVFFVLIGDGKEKPHLNDLKTEYKLNNLYIIDSRPKNELSKVVSASNLCLMIVKNIKIFETNSANKYFDYLSAGKPVLMNYGGWKKDYLLQHNAGINTEPDNPQDMVDTIIELKNNPELLKQMGINARKLAEDEFDCNKSAKKLLNIFESLIK